jgi:hypothetical protein
VAERLPGGGHETGAHHPAPAPDKTLLRDHNDQFAYALVDYELLERTPEHEQAVRSANRQLYLKHMARRFDTDAANPMPAHLPRHERPGRGLHFWPRRKHGRIALGGGQGPGPVQLFSAGTLAAHAQEKIVRPQPDFLHAHQGQHQSGVEGFAHGRLAVVEESRGHTRRRRGNYGFNSPFEEFAFAFEMGRHGVKTVYPRAIYMTGRPRGAARQVSDERRYAALADFLTPDGDPVVRKEYDYITIWGFWNGPDELLAAQDGKFYQAVNVKRAFARQTDFQTNHGGTDADGVAPAGPLRF